jgi:hypothetical protein
VVCTLTVLEVAHVATVERSHRPYVSNGTVGSAARENDDSNGMSPVDPPSGQVERPGAAHRTVVLERA